MDTPHDQIKVPFEIIEWDYRAPLPHQQIADSVARSPNTLKVFSVETNDDQCAVIIACKSLTQKQAQDEFRDNRDNGQIDPTPECDDFDSVHADAEGWENLARRMERERNNNQELYHNAMNEVRALRERDIQWGNKYRAAMETWAEQNASDEGHGWQPIETAPMDGQKILLLLDNSDVPHSGYWKDRHYWCIAWDQYILSEADGPTHWMSLPKPPHNQ